MKDHNTLKNDLNTNYGTAAIESCSNSEEGFIKQITEAFEKIDDNFVAGFDGFKEWQIQAKRLISNIGNTDLEDGEEQAILQRELNRQGVSTNTQESMLKNLEDFNSPEG